MGYPKALLKYRDETFLDTLTGLFGAYCQPVIVVLGAEADRIRAQVARPAHFVINPDYRRGQTTSMQCGLRAAPPDAEGVLFTLVDHPAVAPETIETLLAEPRPAVRVPRHNGQRGHPIWFSRALIPEFLELSEDGAARDVVRRYAEETEFLDVSDSGIVADIDDLEAYRNLTGGIVR